MRDVATYFSDLALPRASSANAEDLAAAVSGSRNPFVSLPLQYKTANQFCGQDIKGQPAVPGSWGPGARTDAMLAAECLTELAVGANVTHNPSDKPIGYRRAACDIVLCVSDLDEGVRLEGLPEAELRKSTVDKMNTFTCAEPPLDVEASYSVILNDWSLATRGWQRATSRQNELMDLKLSLLKEKEDKRQSTQVAQGSYPDQQGK